MSAPADPRIQTLVNRNRTFRYEYVLVNRDAPAEMAASLSKANWSLSNLASMLRLNLFTYRELTNWLHNPMETPPLPLLRSNSLWS
jgi:hypothetical protein